MSHEVGDHRVSFQTRSMLDSSALIYVDEKEACYSTVKTLLITCFVGAINVAMTDKIFNFIFSFFMAKI